MAKGNKCPRCGKQTYHKKKAVRECSSCGTVGWIKNPGSPGAGPGKTCLNCGKRRMKKVFTTEEGVGVFHCSYCDEIHLY